MRIAVTGATGFVGSHLWRELHHAGHELLLVSRRPRPDGDRVKWLAGDLAQSEELIESIASFEPEAIFHLAWEGIPDFAETTSVKNVLTSLKFLDAAAKLSSVRKLIVAGSCWEYGTMQGRCAEDMSTSPTNWFTWAKDCIRHYVARLGDTHRIEWYWPRIFFVYGPGQRAQSLVPSVAASLLAGGVPDVRFPRATNDFVYVTDVAEGLARCLAPGVPPGVYNLGSGIETEVLTVVREIENLLRQDSKVTAAIERAASEPPRAGIIADTTLARDLLGWHAHTDLRQGLAQFLGSS